MKPEFGHTELVFVGPKTGRYYSSKFICDRETCKNTDQNKFEIVDGVAYCEVCNHSASKRY